MANKSFYTFMKIKAPDPSRESLAAFTRKVNEQFEMSAMKLFGNIESKDLHPNLQKTIKAKVGNETFETYIQQTAEEIELLATKEEVIDVADDLGAVAGTVSTHTTQISQNASAIALKANQSTVDSLGNTVSSLSSEVSLIPGQISAEVTNKTIHVGEIPPIGDGLYEGRLWQNTLTDEQLRWRGLPVSSARSYSTTKSGPAVVIDDLSDNRALNVTVKTVAAQAGSGTPSPENVRAISGKTSVTVRRTRKNIAPLAPAGGMFMPTVDGRVAVSGTAGPSGAVCNILGAFQATEEVLKLSGQTVSISGGSPNVSFNLTYYDGATWTLKTVNSGSLTFAIPANCIVTRLHLGIGANVTVSETVWYQAEIAPAATEFEAYAGTDYQLVPDVTIHGLPGYEDQVGNANFTRRYTTLITCHGNSGFAHVAGAQLTNTAMFQCTPSTAAPESPTYAASICTHFVRDTAGYGTDAEGHYVFGTVRLRVNKSRLAGWSDGLTDEQKVALFNAWLEAQNTAGTPVQVLYQRADYHTTTSASVQITGSDGMNVITSDGASVEVEYTGSGWQVISGKANSLYASANMKFDVNGLEINQTSLGGMPVETSYQASTSKYGLFRRSDGKLLNGAKVFKNGKLLGVVGGLTDPDGDGDAYLEVITRSNDEEEGDNGSYTGLRLMGVSYDGASDPDPANPSFNPPQTGNVIGFDLGMQTFPSWDGTKYEDYVEAFMNVPGDFILRADGRLYLKGGDGIGLSLEGVNAVYDGSASDGNPALRIQSHIWPNTSDHECNLGGSAAGNRYYTAYLKQNPNVSSDERLKRDMKPLDRAKDLIMALRPYEYGFKTESKDTPIHMGFGAAQVLEALRGAGMEKCGLVDDSDPDSLGIVYGDLIAPLVAVVQQQQRKIEALEARLSALESRLAKE